MAASTPDGCHGREYLRYRIPPASFEDQIGDAGTGTECETVISTDFLRSATKIEKMPN